MSQFLIASMFRFLLREKLVALTLTRLDYITRLVSLRIYVVIDTRFVNGLSQLRAELMKNGIINSSHLNLCCSRIE
jgi:hypothetical protein